MIGEKLPRRLHWRKRFLIVASSHDSLRRLDYSNAIYYIRSLPATCCEPRPSSHLKRSHHSESNLDLLYKQMLIYCQLIVVISCSRSRIYCLDLAENREIDFKSGSAYTPVRKNSNL